jgi:hypothetical protein
VKKSDHQQVRRRAELRLEAVTAVWAVWAGEWGLLGCCGMASWFWWWCVECGVWNAGGWDGGVALFRRLGPGLTSRTECRVRSPHLSTFDHWSPGDRVTEMDQAGRIEWPFKEYLVTVPASDSPWFRACQRWVNCGMSV